MMNNSDITKEELNMLLSALSDPNTDMDINTRSTLEQYVNVSSTSDNDDFHMSEEDKELYRIRDIILSARNTFDGFYYKDGEATSISLVGVDMNKGRILFKVHSNNKHIRSASLDFTLEEMEDIYGKKVI